jgi:hypothetical protein
MGLITALVDYKFDYSPAWYVASTAIMITGLLVLIESLRSRWRNVGCQRPDTHGEAGTTAADAPRAGSSAPDREAGALQEAPAPGGGQSSVWSKLTAIKAANIRVR